MSNTPDDFYKSAYQEWITKTDWVQETVAPKELGLHRADILRQRIQDLEKELAKESARTAEEKLRADRVTEQHRMQCQMREGLEREVVALRAAGAQGERAMPIEQAAAEALAQHIDTLDNLAGALALSLPAHMHVAALREQLPALVRRMRADFAAATGNNPWETHDDQ